MKTSHEATALQPTFTREPSGQPRDVTGGHPEDGGFVVLAIGHPAAGGDIEPFAALDEDAWVGRLGPAGESVYDELRPEEGSDLAGTRIEAAKEAFRKATGLPCDSLGVARRQAEAVLFEARAGNDVLLVLTYPLALSVGPRRMVALVVEEEKEHDDGGATPASEASSSTPPQRAATVANAPPSAGPARAPGAGDEHHQQELPPALTYLYPNRRFNPFEIGVDTSGPMGQPVFRYRFPLTFSDCSDVGGSAYFARFLAWMGQIRELSVAPILPELKELFASGKWGSVTNGWETFHFDEANQEDRIEGRFYATRRHGQFDAAFDLITEWSAIDRMDRHRPLALTFMTASWVEVIGHAEVKLAPMPPFFDKYMRLMVTSFGESGRGIVDPSARPEVETMWGSRLHEHRRGVDGWPVVYELSTQTTLDHANLVGNVYYANYPRWAGRCRDMYFFKVAPELYRAEDHPGELLCRRMKIDHLREAMPFDRVLTEMSIRAVYRCGVALAFQMYRVDDDGSRTKLAVAEQDVVFGTRAKGALEPRPMPERVVEALRQATRVR